MGTVRTRLPNGIFLPCGHKNVEMGEDEEGKFYKCWFDHKTYWKDMIPEKKPDLMYR